MLIVIPSFGATRVGCLRQLCVLFLDEIDTLVVIAREDLFNVSLQHVAVGNAPELALSTVPPITAPLRITGHIAPMPHLKYSAFLAGNCHHLARRVLTFWPENATILNGGYLIYCAFLALGTILLCLDVVLLAILQEPLPDLVVLGLRTDAQINTFFCLGVGFPLGFALWLCSST